MANQFCASVVADHAAGKLETIPATAKLCAGIGKQCTADEATMAMGKINTRNEELSAEKARAEERDRLNGEVSCKVAKQGGLTVAGLGSGRWPVTQYIPVWENIFKNRELIEAFIEKHRVEFSTGPKDPRFIAEKA